MEQANRTNDNSYRPYNEMPGFAGRIAYFFAGVEPPLLKNLPYEARAHRAIGLYSLFIILSIITGIILFSLSYDLPNRSLLLSLFVVIAFAVTMRGYFTFINGSFYNGWISFFFSLII